MHILKFPNEILLNIVDLVEDNKSLCALAQACRRFQLLSESAIYSNLLFRHYQRCNNVKQAIESSARRATYIKVLDVRPEYLYNETDYGKNIITSVLRQCSKLQELTVESPFCNYGRWRRKVAGWIEVEKYLPTSLMEAMRDTSAKGLSKLVLHLEGNVSRYWDPNAGHECDHITWSEIMALPTLRELTISCACIHDAVHFGKSRSTGLRKMSLIECNISITGLKQILSAPVALETLHLGENVYHGAQGSDIPHGADLPVYNKLSARHLDEFISALAQQSDSLREIEYITDQSGLSNSTTKSFKDFTKLRNVKLSEGTETLQRAMFSHDSPPKLVSLSLDVSSDELYNKLKKLRNKIESSERVLTAEELSSEIASEVSTIISPRFSQKTLQNLQELHIITEDLVNPREIPSDLRRWWMKLMVEHWRNYDVELFLYTRWRQSIFPPILYGEEDSAPRTVLNYSSDHGVELIQDV